MSNTIKRNNKNYIFLENQINILENNIMKNLIFEFLIKMRAFLYNRNSDFNFIEKLDFSVSSNNLIYYEIYNNPCIKETLEKHQQEYKKFINCEEISDMFMGLYKFANKASNDFFHIKYYNMFDFGVNVNTFLQLDLSRPLNEIIEILKLYKKHYDKNFECEYKKRDEERFILLNKEIKSFLKKRNKIIKIETKIVDVIFYIDCLYLNKEEIDIKKNFVNFYIENYSTIDLTYILKDYYKNIKNLAHSIYKTFKSIEV